jgi:hypothetical protein
MLFSVNHGLEEGSAVFEIQDAITTTDANGCRYFFETRALRRIRQP